MPDVVVPVMPGGVRRAAADLQGDLLLAAALVGTITAVLLAVEPLLWHPFVVPVAACGVLVGVDVAAWLRRRLDVFDPRAMLGLLGFHFFFLAPLLHVMLDYWPATVQPPTSWRDALGAMAVLNCIGLLLYRIVLVLPAYRRRAGGGRFRVDEKRLVRVVAVAVALGVLAFGVEIAMFGGFSGYLTAMTGERGVLSGTGWLLILAESFPLLTFLLVLLRWRRTLVGRPGVVALLLVGLAVVQFLVGGLRGSRSNTVWPVLLGLILVHLLVVQVSRKALAIVALFFVCFMYLYGIYKSGGTQAVDAVRSGRSVTQLSAETGRDVPTLLLGDLARADIQAVLLDRKRSGVGELGYGVSYLGDLTTVVPRAVLPERVPSKIDFGTEVIAGPGAFDYESGRWVSRVYGIAGEAMLNFGPAGAVASFLVLGLLIRGVTSLYLRARDGDRLAPRILAPSLCLASVLMLTSDLDNITIVLLTRFAPVGLAVLFATTVLRAKAGPVGAAAQRPAEAPRTTASRTSR
ncbi:MULTISPECIES: hypothetical protein [unclassified Plantactinospora]|uniref:hypothetical protein n=1 Tax=unclassified Plantactinospora TaxID=2631981 RepID=UPI00131EFAE8|nr:MULTISPECIES: hypothetical protein [unclassified Plantactinospora]